MTKKSGSSNAANEASPAKKARSDADLEEAGTNDTRKFLEMFRGEFLKHFDTLSIKLEQNQDRFKAEISEQLSSLSAKSDTATSTANQALKEIHSLKADIQDQMSKMSRAPSEASTEPPPPSTPARARTSSAPMAPSPFVSAPQHPPAGHSSATQARGPFALSTAASTNELKPHPDNDGRTILVAGFPRDVPRETLQPYLTEKLSQHPGVHDVFPRYRFGSVGLMRFDCPDSMWAFLRNPPKLTYLDSHELFFTIPKTAEERARNSMLASMRKAIAQSMNQADPDIRILWREGLIRVENIVVSRISPNNANKMDLSQSRLTQAGISATADSIYEIFKNLRSTSSSGADDVTDWS